MKKYEAMFIIKPDLEKDAKKKAMDLIAGAVTKEGGEIKDVNEWGKHRLAYKIKRHNEGLYILAHFNMPSEKLANAQKAYNLSDEILKALIIADDGIAQPQQAKPAVAAA